MTPMDIADVLKAKQPRRKTVTVILDADIELDLSAAEDAVADARSKETVRGAPNVALNAAIVARDELRERARAVSKTFVFEATGRKQYSDLRDQHPPTPDQRREWKALWMRQGLESHQISELSHNTDTFPPVLLAASCIDPVMTVDQATELWSSAGWSDSELAALFGAALEVNTTSRRHDLGNG